MGMFWGSVKVNKEIAHNKIVQRIVRAGPFAK